MNSVHGHWRHARIGPVEIEKNEPVFHSDWEARVHALNLPVASPQVEHRTWGATRAIGSRPANTSRNASTKRWAARLEMLLVGTAGHAKSWRRARRIRKRAERASSGGLRGGGFPARAPPSHANDDELTAEVSGPC